MFGQPNPNAFLALETCRNCPLYQGCWGGDISPGGVFPHGSPCMLPAVPTGFFPSPAPYWGSAASQPWMNGVTYPWMGPTLQQPTNPCSGCWMQEMCSAPSGYRPTWPTMAAMPTTLMPSMPMPMQTPTPSPSPSPTPSPTPTPSPSPSPTPTPALPSTPPPTAIVTRPPVLPPFLTPEQVPVPPPALPTPVSPSLVFISRGTYQPNIITVPANTAVEWFNLDTDPHTVTAINGLFDSGPIAPGTSFSYVFTQPELYNYYCKFHPNMRGTVVVLPA